MDKSKVFGGVVRAGLAIASITHLAAWVKAAPGRSMGIRLWYEPDGAARWHGVLIETDRTITEQTGTTFDGLIALLMTTIGGHK